MVCMYIRMHMLSQVGMHLFVHDIGSHDVLFEDRADVDVTHGDRRLAFFP